jgi:hypothetical protein
LFRRFPKQTVTDNYHDTATIPPTVARIKSLKLPANFQIAKFAKIENPRILAVAPDGTIYVSHRNVSAKTGLSGQRPNFA